MWVEKTKTGKYKYTERYTDYMTGKIRRVSVTMEKNNPSTKKLARQALLRIIEERQNEEPEEVQPLTLWQLVEHYRAYQKQSVKESTYRRNFYQCKALLEILGADVLVENLTANYIKERFLQTGEAFSTLNERRIRLIALLNWGYENDYITDVAYLRKFKPFKDATHREKIQDKYLESKELTTLIRGIEIKKWQQLTRFLVLSGLRIGEALALTAADLDMYNKVIHVNKTYDANNRSVGTPKTLCSIRDVYIQPELEPICRDLLLTAKLESMAYGVRTPLLFFNRNGNHINPFSYNKYLRERSEKLIGRRITAHTLRHYSASIQHALGIPDSYIMQRGGWGNDGTLKAVYRHALADKTKEMDDIANQHFNELCNTKYNTK